MHIDEDAVIGVKFPVGCIYKFSDIDQVRVNMSVPNEILAASIRVKNIPTQHW
jgi:hypothetical protein